MSGIFGRRRKAATTEDGIAASSVRDGSNEKHGHNHKPLFNHKGHKVTKGINPEGESGRKGIHPLHFLRICFRSSCKASMVRGILTFHWPAPGPDLDGEDRGGQLLIHWS